MTPHETSDSLAERGIKVKIKRFRLHVPWCLISLMSLEQRESLFARIANHPHRKLSLPVTVDQENFCLALELGDSRC
jgi:hypothetical protein